MKLLFNLIAAAASIYSLLIFVRIIISWMRGAVSGKPVQLLNSITDPYLEWWRNALNLRIGPMDLSPVAALAFLSVIQSIFSNLSRFERVTLGRLLAVVILSTWSVLSFILGFCLIVIILRLIAHLTNRNMLNPFWKVVDNISQPVLYRTNRIVFGDSIQGYVKGIAVCLVMLAVIRFGGGYVIHLFAGLMAGLPF